MIGPTRSVRVLAWGAPVDMRKGFEGLSPLVRHELRADVLAGAMYLFVGRSRRTAKVLYFDGTGLCLLHKRLARDRFAALWREGAARRRELSPTELALFLEGSALVGRIPLSPQKINDVDLAARAQT